MRLIFVRHGQSEGNLERKFQGWTDAPLSETGYLQAKLAGEEMKQYHIDRIYSSDLKRAYCTAQAVAEGRNLEITIDKRLREINGGDWEDVPWNTLEKDFADSYQAWAEQPHLHKMPNGESMEEFYNRAVSFLNDILADTEETICIATHGTFIKCIVCYCKGLALEDLYDVNWHDNASITIIDYKEGRFTVTLEGYNEHLGEHSTFLQQSWWKEEMERRKKRMLTKEKIIEILKEADVLLEGHFILTSGRHSAKYLQCAKLFKNAKYSELLCADLAKKFAEDNVELVVGPAVGAVIMAYEMGKQCGTENIFAERENGEMTFRRGFKVEQGQRVLVVEDVVTTGGSVKEVIKLVQEAGGIVAGIGSIVDRTGGKIDFGVKYEAVISMEVESFDPDNCPLCAAGTPAVKPGSRSLK